MARPGFLPDPTPPGAAPNPLGKPLPPPRPFGGKGRARAKPKAKGRPFAKKGKLSRNLKRGR